MWYIRQIGRTIVNGLKAVVKGTEWTTKQVKSTTKSIIEGGEKHLVQDIVKREMGRRSSIMLAYFLKPAVLTRILQISVKLRLWSWLATLFGRKFWVYVTVLFIICFGSYFKWGRKNNEFWYSYLSEKIKENVPLVTALTGNTFNLVCKLTEWYFIYIVSIKIILFMIAFIHANHIDSTIWYDWSALNQFINNGLQVLQNYCLQQVQYWENQLKYVIVDVLAATHAEGGKIAFVEAYKELLSELPREVGYCLQGYYGQPIMLHNIMEDFIWKITKKSHLPHMYFNDPLHNPVDLVNKAVDIRDPLIWSGYNAMYSGQPLPVYIQTHTGTSVTLVVICTVIVASLLFLFFTKKGDDYKQITLERINSGWDVAKEGMKHPIESVMQLLRLSRGASKPGDAINTNSLIDLVDPFTTIEEANKDTGLDIQSRPGGIIEKSNLPESPVRINNAGAGSVTNNISVYIQENSNNKTFSNEQKKIEIDAKDNSWKTWKDNANEKSGAGLLTSAAAATGVGVITQAVTGNADLVKQGAKLLTKGATHVAGAMTGVDLSAVAPAIQTATEVVTNNLPQAGDLARRSMRRAGRMGKFIFNVTTKPTLPPNNE